MRRTWIKLYVEQTLRGTCFQQLEPDERFVWFGFLLLAGDNCIEGKISVTDKVGYTVEQIAYLLACDVELVEQSIKKFIKYGKIKINKKNVIEVIKWKKYQSEYQRQKKYRDKKLQPKVTTKSYSKSNRVDIEGDIDIDKEEDIDNKDTNSRAKPRPSPPYSEIISYLNQKANKGFKPGTKNTQKHIRARWNEGYSFDDFKKVVDIKAVKWKGDPKMVDYLRPETLFGPKFESYLNEHLNNETIEKVKIREAQSCFYKNEDSCSLILKDMFEKDLPEKCEICLRERDKWKN